MAGNPDFINSWSEAARLRNSFNNGYVYVSRDQRLSNFKKFSKALKPEDYHRAAKDMWEGFKPRYRTQANKSMAKTLDKIHKNLATLSETDIAPPAEFSPTTFDQTDFGAAGGVLARDIYSKDKIHRVLYLSLIHI